MRIHRGVPQARGDQLLELLGEDVLEDLGLGVHPIPAHPELLGQEQLDQAVVAQHLKRHRATLVGQPHAAIGLVLDQPHLVSLRTIAETEPGVTPRRSARSLVDTAAPSRVSSAYTALA